MKNRIPKPDIILAIAVIIISIFGILMIYSSSYIWAEYKFDDPFKYMKSQSMFFIIGLVLMYIVSKIPYELYKKYALTLLGGCILLLILVIIPGIGTVRNGSRSWFGIGPFGIQTSEFTKLALIIFIAKYMSNYRFSPKKP